MVYPGILALVGAVRQAQAFKGRGFEIVLTTDDPARAEA
jgi:hypothetical protein